MNPAHNQVAFVRIVAVLPKVTALILELYSHMLPPLPPLIYGAFAFAVGIFCSDRFDEKTQLKSYHSEDIDYTLLVDGRKAQPAKINRFAKLNFLALF